MDPEATDGYRGSVMISLHVGSMGPSARLLQKHLQSIGIKVWLCMDMKGGDSYRDEIVEAIDNAQFVIIMLNARWAESGECYDEFNYAKRCSLTSHESGRTDRGTPRQPVFVPIAFSDLDWNAHKHVKLLAASVNFIVHGAPDLLQGNGEATMALVSESLEASGLLAPAAMPAGSGKAASEALRSHSARGAGVESADEARFVKLERLVESLSSRLEALEAGATRPKPGAPVLVSRTQAARVVEDVLDIDDPNVKVELGSSYCGNCLTLSRWNDLEKLPTWNVITITDLVVAADNTVTCKVSRQMDLGFEWSIYDRPMPTDQKKQEITESIKSCYKGRPFKGDGIGTLSQIEKRLDLVVEEWEAPLTEGFTVGWSQDTYVFTIDSHARLVGFASSEHEKAEYGQTQVHRIVMTPM